MKILLFTLLFAPALLWAETKPSEPAEPAEPYPLETCVVAGSKLDSMGGPYIHDHEGTEVRFCCKGCLPRFNREPEKYLKMIEKAREAEVEPSEADADHAHEH